jgi:hypothetical protein
VIFSTVLGVDVPAVDCEVSLHDNRQVRLEISRDWFEMAESNLSPTADNIAVLDLATSDGISLGLRQRPVDHAAPLLGIHLARSDDQLHLAFAAAHLYGSLSRVGAGPPALAIQMFLDAGRTRLRLDMDVE